MSVCSDGSLSVLPGCFRKGCWGLLFLHSAARAPELQWERQTCRLETSSCQKDRLAPLACAVVTSLPLTCWWAMSYSRSNLLPGLSQCDLSCFKSLGSWAVSKAVLPGLRKGRGASRAAQWSRNPPVKQEMCVRSLGRENPLQKEMITHSSILAWEIAWTEEPGGLQSIGSWKSLT